MQVVGGTDKGMKLHPPAGFTVWLAMPTGYGVGCRMEGLWTVPLGCTEGSGNLCFSMLISNT